METRWRWGPQQPPASPSLGHREKTGLKSDPLHLTSEYVLAVQSLPPCAGTKSISMSLEPSTEPDTQLWMCACGGCVAEVSMSVPWTLGVCHDVYVICVMGVVCGVCYLYPPICE